MYEAFDKFLARDTWHTSHPLDEQVFYRCLHEVIGDEEFSPDEMGDYIREQKGIERDADNPLDEAIDRWVSNAWAVRDYLSATKNLDE